MPAGTRVATVTPGLVEEPIDRGPTAQDAFDRIQKAFETGILNYNEIVDGLTVKPQRRRAEMGKLEDELAKQKAAKENRPMREAIEKNVLRQGQAQSGFDAAVAEAQYGFHKPDAIGEIGRMRAAGDVQDAELDMAKKEAMLRQAHNLVDDPEGLKEHYRKSTLELGGNVTPGMSLDELKLAFQSALRTSQERGVEKMRLQAMLDKYTKSGEALPKIEADLRKEFYGNERVSLFNKVAPMYAKIRAFGDKQNRGDTPTAADDMGMIFSYMKILDPGSTVREGEYATAENTTNLPDRVLREYNKVLTGQKLSPQQRSDFVAAAHLAFQPHYDYYQALRRDYSALAQAAGASPKNVVGSDDAGIVSPPGAESPGTPTAASKPKTPPTNPALPPGQAWVRNKLTGKIFKARLLPNGDWDPVD